jgi:hypothetical protein
LLLAALALAAAQPYLTTGGSATARKLEIVDASASMSALDRPGGKPRIAPARELVRGMIEKLHGGRQIALVRMGGSALRVSDFTDDKGELLRALAQIEPEDVPANVPEALRLADAIRRSTPFEEAIMVSDGNLPERTDFPLSFALRFQRVPAATANAGIVGCSARRRAEGGWEVLVRVATSDGFQPGTASLLLKSAGAIIAEESFTPAPGQESRIVLGITATSDQLVEVEFRPSGFDAMAADNHAWLRLSAHRKVQAYVAPKLAAWRKAIASFPTVNMLETGPLGADLAVLEDFTPLPIPVIVTLGVIPEPLKPLVTPSTGSVRAVDWERDGALLRHVGLDEVVFLDSPVADLVSIDRELAARGFETVIMGPTGPLAVAAQSADAIRLHLLFHTDRTTLPYRVGFPMLAANLVNAAVQIAGLGDVTAHSTGVLAPIPATASTVYRVSGPGMETETRSDEAGYITGIAALRAGVFEFEPTTSSVPSIVLGASVLSQEETTLVVRESLGLADSIKVPSQSEPAAKGDSSLWGYLAFAALGLLALEWFWYQQRP